jgi:PAS domain S-box-containing protein
MPGEPGDDSVPAAADLATADLATHSLSALQPLTAALLEAVTPADVVEAVVKHGMMVLRAEAGLVALVANGGTDLRVATARGYADGILAAWNRFPLADRLPLSDAVREKTALFFTDRADWQVRYPDMFRRGPTHPVKASVTLPLVARGQALGGLHFSFAEERDAFTDAERAFLLELARQGALALDRALLIEAVEAARRQEEFLSRASALLTESLDYQTTLDAVARLAVPDLSDWASVDLVEEGESCLVRNLAVSHADPAEVAWVREARQRYPIDMTQTGQPVVQVISTGKTIFLPDIPEELLVAAARDAEQLRLIRRLDLHSYLCVPLRTAQGKTLGAVTLATTHASGRTFTEETVAMAEELARRAAVAIDNAHLFQSAATAQRRAEAAQRRVEGVLESMGEMFFSLDADWRFTYVNARACALWDKTAVELLGKSAWAVFPEMEQSPYREFYDRAFRELTVVEFEIDVGPQIGWLEARVYPSLPPAPPGLSVYYHSVTERKRAEAEREQLVAELSEANQRQRRFLREMLLGFTDGRLRLCDARTDLPAPLAPLSPPVDLSAPTLRLLRRQVEAFAEGFRLSKERLYDLQTAVGEAAMNAVRHGGGGMAQVRGEQDTGTVQVWIEDHGPGIAEDLIHRAVERGWSTGGFGHGFFLMRSCADRLYLLTGTQGTTVVLEQERTVRPPVWY